MRKSHVRDLHGLLILNYFIKYIFNIIWASYGLQIRMFISRDHFRKFKKVLGAEQIYTVQKEKALIGPFRGELGPEHLY